MLCLPGREEEVGEKWKEKKWIALFYFHFILFFLFTWMELKAQNNISYLFEHIKCLKFIFLHFHQIFWQK